MTRLSSRIRRILMDGFVPPVKEECLQALGPTSYLPEVLQRALDPSHDFSPLPSPGMQDWLSAHEERGQTYDEFASGPWPAPNPTRRVIYIQPLGEFPPFKSPRLDLLHEYIAAFTSLETRLLPPISGVEARFSVRTNPLTRTRQVLTTDILWFLESRLPENAFCVLGITMTDLYPEPEWNYVFGHASLTERVGAFSFARLDPVFYGNLVNGEERACQVLKRSCKMLAHETAHMFGIGHCIYFHCALNGSNHLKESDATPMNLCPICLRKLQSSVGFDVLAYYQHLASFYRRAGFRDEARWVNRRLSKII
jgi:archaemetzincin